jgi:S-formylglutathione hydrolase FrmB
VIAVTFQHPTPYFDDSYAVNSVNNGPYGDAILKELIPYLESHFRVIAQPYARVLTGGSTGGWESLALQLYHPDFFGGTWTLYPDPIDFRHYMLIDAYRDTNAFTASRDGQPAFTPINRWFSAERSMMRGNDGQPLITIRQLSQFEDVLASHGRSGEQLEIWEAVYGPIGADGYPVPLWDKRTGHINHDVSTYMREHGYDLTAYARQHWAELGPQLTDKIHIDVGDMDNFYLNLGVYDFQSFLDSTQNPHLTGVFRFGRPEKGHGWQHTNNANLVREMADAIAKHAPAGTAGAWRY